MEQSRTTVRLVSSAVALGVAALLASCSGVANTPGKEGADHRLTVITSAPWNTTNGKVATAFLDALEEAADGRISLERLDYEALCPQTEAAACVADGRAQLGLILPSYTPQLFPDEALVGVPFLAESGKSVMSALYEINTEDEALQAMYERNGLRYVAMWSAGRMLIGTKTPAEGPADLAGRSIRATGAILQPALQKLGVDVVAIPTAEVYESLERGVVDGAGYSLDGVVNYRFVEQLPYWTDAGNGHYAAFGLVMNAEAFQGLDADLQEVVDDVIAEFNGGAALDVFDAEYATLCAELLAAPTFRGLSAWSADEVAAWRSALGDEPRAAWEAAAAEAGLADPKALFDRYVELLDSSDAAGVADPTVGCVADARG